MGTIKRFVVDEAGLESVEWAVMAALITGALLTAVTLIGTGVASRFENNLQVAVGQ